MDGCKTKGKRLRGEKGEDLAYQTRAHAELSEPSEVLGRDAWPSTCSQSALFLRKEKAGWKTSAEGGFVKVTSLTGLGPMRSSPSLDRSTTIG